jgi:hypothetical protein
MPKLLVVLSLSILITHLLPISALAVTVANPSDQVRLLSRNQLHLAGECSKQIGPFVTQTTAWQRLRQYESQGYGMSSVFPCPDPGRHFLKLSGS